MKCATCGRTLVVGTVTEGDQRRSYHVCPYCSRPLSRRTRAGEPDQEPREQPADVDREEREIVEVIRTLPPGSRARLLAFEALAEWHTRALSVIAWSLRGQDAAGLLAVERNLLLDTLERITREESQS